MRLHVHEAIYVSLVIKNLSNQWIDQRFLEDEDI